MRLDRWFKMHFPDLSFGHLQKLVRTGQVRVEGGRVKTSTRLGKRAGHPRAAARRGGGDGTRRRGCGDACSEGRRAGRAGRAQACQGGRRKAGRASRG